uniref:Putative secreted protein n=1 Tax=Rhipicephalus microplus TaxID=6941 RepID=A0A6G5A3V4_RHIMP
MWQIHLFCAASKLWCALMVLIISGPLLLCVPPLITSYCSFFSFWSWLHGSSLNSCSMEQCNTGGCVYFVSQLFHCVAYVIPQCSSLCRSGSCSSCPGLQTRMD